MYFVSQSVFLEMHTNKRWASICVWSARRVECDKLSSMNGHSRGRGTGHALEERHTMGEENLINYWEQYQDRESLLVKASKREINKYTDKTGKFWLGLILYSKEGPMGQTKI